ncbi:phasin family protein [Methylobacterium sp. J-026]|uniref:phasin family protein n=1 Tax=Methylobacterium sp. J-026 TaxID=2836624 RepID=UPI001FBAF38A|nr:phasin family protein [Methylobacterium sp. J-026]MCJ2137206.1 phasin family protein [Methylobacterium sp. J-026]
MQTRNPHPSFPVPPGFGTPLRRFGAVSRTAQSVGIEWADSARQGLDDLKATLGKLATARGPAEVLSVQSAYLQRAGARLVARTTVAADLVSALTTDLLRPPTAPRPGRAR